MRDVLEEIGDNLIDKYIEMSSEARLRVLNKLVNQALQKKVEYKNVQRSRQ